FVGEPMKLLTTMALSGFVWSGCVIPDVAPDTAIESTESSEASEPADASDSASLDELVARNCDSRFRLPNNIPIPDATGAFATVSSLGFIDLRNEFFQDLGSNGRRCVSCHLPTAGWTVTPAQLGVVFEATDGG